MPASFVVGLLGAVPNTITVPASSVVAIGAAARCPSNCTYTWSVSCRDDFGFGNVIAAFTEASPGGPPYNLTLTTGMRGAKVNINTTVFGPQVKCSVSANASYVDGSDTLSKRQSVSCTVSPRPVGNAGGAPHIGERASAQSRASR